MQGFDWGKTQVAIPVVMSNGARFCFVRVPCHAYVNPVGNGRAVMGLRDRLTGREVVVGGRDDTLVRFVRFMSRAVEMDRMGLRVFDPNGPTYVVVFGAMAKSDAGHMVIGADCPGGGFRYEGYGIAPPCGGTE